MVESEGRLSNHKAETVELVFRGIWARGFPMGCLENAEELSDGAPLHPLHVPVGPQQGTDCPQALASLSLPSSLVHPRRCLPQALADGGPSQTHCFIADLR